MAVRHKIFCALFSGGAAIFSPPALAQADQGMAGEIIVTAQRRAEPLQKVPIAVTAFQEGQLREQNITDLVSLRSKLATFDFKTTGHTAGIYIRGIGQNGAFPNNENSVAMYVDDVYMGLAQMTRMPFNNIQQLVVLKGPQGTLFGRNATGGVVQITTADPMHDAKLDASLGYGNFQTVTASFYGTVGLGDKVAANVAAIYENQGEGWGRNLFLGEDVHKKRRLGLRSKFLFQPADGTDILMALDYNDERNTGLSQRPVAGNPRLATYPADAGRFDTYSNFDDSAYIRHGGASLKLTQELGFGSFVSISSYRKMKAYSGTDQDATPASVVSANNWFRGSQWTQELQLLSDASSKLKWTMGGFYYWSDPSFEQYVVEQARRLYSTQKTRSLAAYAQLTYPIFEGTNVTGGLRYTNEHQTLVDAYTRTNAGVRADFADLSQRFSKFTWRLSIDQQLTRDILAYASYNRGIKTGGFNLGSPTAAPFKPEKLDAFEVGLKTQLFDRRVRLNLAAFYYDYADLQVSQAVLGVTTITNAATARIKGMDGDIDITVTDHLSLFGSAGLLDSKYKRFTNSIAFTITGARLGDPVNGLDVSGNDTTFAPKFTGGFGARYQIDTRIGRMTANANLNHFGGAFTTPDEQARIPAYTLVNASIEWLSRSEAFNLRLWTANLTNTHYLGYAGQNAVGRMIVAGEPRTYGVTFGVHF